MNTPSSLRWLPLAAALAAAAGTAQAQEEQGRVISSTPVIQQVAVPRQVCTDEQVTYQRQKSGAGALLGAIAGGAMGNAIGDGSGRAAATAIGLIGGAVLGNRVEGSPQPYTETVRSCGDQVFYENRTVAYDVVYEYAGRQYRTQMAEDPGRFVRLSVTPVDSLPAPSAYPPPRPQVHYQTAPTRIVSERYVIPTYPVHTGVVIIGGQRYHRGPDWRPRHDHGHGHGHRFERNRHDR